MPLHKNGEFTDDTWHVVDDESPLEPGRASIVSFDRLLGEADLSAFDGPLGVTLRPGEPVEKLEPLLDQLALVALEFPKFTDGRAYSSAKILRERFGFKGEIRAVGDVLVDQYQFMLRCGFDAFEIAKGRPLESWSKANVAMSLAYQADGSSRHGPTQSIFESRRQARNSLAA